MKYLNIIKQLSAIPLLIFPELCKNWVNVLKGFICLTSYLKH